MSQFDPKDYLEHIGERVEDWTYLKFPYSLKLGWPEGVYRVGPLARLNVCDRTGTPKADAELAEWKSLGGGKPVQGRSTTTMPAWWKRLCPGADRAAAR